MDRATFMERVAHRLSCDPDRAEAVTAAVFRELRDRLTTVEAKDVASQMPVALKKLWLEGETADRAVRRTHVPEFIEGVRRIAGLSDDREAERGVKAVFGALQELLGSPSGKEGEAWDIFSQLPKDLKMLWLSAGDYPKAGRRSVPL